MGLGVARPDNLARIRKQAAEARDLGREGIDPIEHRKIERLRRMAASQQDMTFKECAEAYIEAHRAGWRNQKHAAQWSATLETYAYPIFGAAPVAAINVELVLKALQPIWNAKTETASRVRQRIEAVLNWAKARGLREGENPAQWRGHLDKLLPARARVQRVRHHPAMPYAEIPDFARSLADQEGAAAKAMQLLILTAARTSEVLHAQWCEFDLDAGVWLIPAERMKAGREHRVPLSAAAVEIVRAMESQRQSTGWVFPGAKSGRPLSNMALLKLLDRMGHGKLTVHGFRSSFRDWAAERTAFPREVAEAALAHVLANKVEAAYRRSDLFDKRRDLMEAWAKFASPRPSAARSSDHPREWKPATVVMS